MQKNAVSFLHFWTKINIIVNLRQKKRWGGEIGYGLRATGMEEEAFDGERGMEDIVGDINRSFLDFFS